MMVGIQPFSPLKTVFKTRLPAEKTRVKKWVEKLIENFDFEFANNGTPGAPGQVPAMSEERATLLYLIDIFNKHLIEVDGHPVRKTREILDEFAKELLDPKDNNLDRVLFRFRQFFSAYRVDETAYFHKTFEDFRTIIWDFVDQLAEDMGQEQKDDSEIQNSLSELKEAVESNSIEVLKNHSRKFIDCYMEKQFKKDKRRASRMKSIRKNLAIAKKQLGEANNSARIDHLTGALNRKSFDQYVEQYRKLAQGSGQPVCMILIDIDHFKKINDTYGHPVGDFTLKELVIALKSMFTRDADILARIGGEEFGILLPEHTAEQGMQKAEAIIRHMRKEVFVLEERELRFTVSAGVAVLGATESAAEWYKRADLALYNSKNSGRNRATLAPAALNRAA